MCVCVCVCMYLSVDYYALREKCEGTLLHWTPIQQTKGYDID